MSSEALYGEHVMLLHAHVLSVCVPCSRAFLILPIQFPVFIIGSFQEMTRYSPWSRQYICRLLDRGIWTWEMVKATRPVLRCY